MVTVRNLRWAVASTGVAIAVVGVALVVGLVSGGGSSTPPLAVRAQTGSSDSSTTILTVPVATASPSVPPSPTTTTAAVSSTAPVTPHGLPAVIVATTAPPAPTTTTTRPPASAGAIVSLRCSGEYAQAHLGPATYPPGSNVYFTMYYADGSVGGPTPVAVNTADTYGTNVEYTGGPAKATSVQATYQPPGGPLSTAHAACS
jgi:hypothetical protein